MTYIPVIVPPTASQPPSPRTRELAKLLAKVLDEYTKAHPKTTNAEVRAAIRLAQAAAGPDRTVVATAVSLGVGVLVALVALGFFFLAGEGGGGELTLAMPMVVMALIVFLGIVVALIKIASR